MATTNLKNKFISLPSLHYPVPDLQSNIVASSLLSFEGLHAQEPLTYDIEQERAKTPIPPAAKVITDQEIFLDISRGSSIADLSTEMLSFGHPSFSPEHSLFAKVQADVARWTNTHQIEKIGISNTPLKREIKQIKVVYFSIQKHINKRCSTESWKTKQQQ